ncbi:hypothetical protein [Micromonospora sp. NPDC093277]|uniref:hypothetical protein n=1 Tax=Micromonospora sp. NPDC093277 TaxID=3364291 RepID=UPI00380FB15A
MFSTIIRRRLRAACAALSAGDPGPLQRLLRRRFHLCALGIGDDVVVETTDGLHHWLRRLLRTVAGAALRCEAIAVQGPIWSAVVACHLVVCRPANVDRPSPDRYALFLSWQWTGVRNALLMPGQSNIGAALALLAATEAEQKSVRPQEGHA